MERFRNEGRNFLQVRTITVGASLIRWVTVLFADTVYFTKVDMFDLPCKSNSICKGRAFARYIRLATDSICFATGKT